jgi:hypothetical protein
MKGISEPQSNKQLYVMYIARSWGIDAEVTQLKKCCKL